MIPHERLRSVIERHESITARLSQNPDPETLVALSRELSGLDPVVEAARALESERAELEETRALLDDAETDADMRALAEEERERLEASIVLREEAMRVLLLPKDAADERDVVLEIRAGTGGDEAALFAADLLRMYERYAGLKGWKVDVLEMSEAGTGGIKEVVANVSGAGAYARLKYESGVHRVQRVPATESQGRIHTSAATVAVLPQAEEVDVDVRSEDIRIDTMRASGAGGQHVNTTDSAVRITHLPTGIVVTSSEKSQHQNRANAMKALRAKLYEMERSRAASERAEARASQVGTGDRSERIRTYNFPQGRVTDHRINLTLYKLQPVLDGEALDEIVDALTNENQARLLASLEDEAA